MNVLKKSRTLFFVITIILTLCYAASCKLNNIFIACFQHYNKIVFEKKTEKINIERQKNKNIFLTLFLTDLDNIVDLGNPKKNSFEANNFLEIKRFYYKISYEDAKFLILNRASPIKIKDYFIKKRLESLPVLNTVTEKKTFGYIPENRSGLYFCYQEVKLFDNRKFNFFQVYNFGTRKPVAFDVESSISFLFPFEENLKKISIYDKEALLLEEKNVGSDFQIKIENRAYNRVFVEIRADSYFLFDVSLNGIKKSFRDIAVFYDNSDNKLKFFGFLPSWLLQKKASKLFLKIANLYDTVLASSVIENIDKSGNFYVELKKEFLPKEELIMSLYLDNELLKSYRLNLFFTDGNFVSNKEPNYLVPNEDVIIGNRKAVFFINREIFSNIATIKSFITHPDKRKEAVTIELRDMGFDVNLPENEGEYMFDFELILKDGKSINESFKIRKIDLNNFSNKKVVISNNDYDKSSITFYNPFNNVIAFTAIFDTDIKSLSSYNAKAGVNKIILPDIIRDSSNLKFSVILYDFNNQNILYIVKNFFDVDRAMKLVRANFVDAGEKVVVENYGDQKLEYIYAQKFVGNFDYKNYLFNTLYRYNDITVPSFNNELLLAYRIKVDSGFNNAFSFNVNNGNDYTIAFFAIDDKRDVLYSYKYMKRASIFQASFLMPEVIYENDMPDILFNVKNLASDKMDIDFKIDANNCIAKLESQYLKLEPYQSKSIKIFLEKYNVNYPIVLALDVMVNRKILKRYVKEIRIISKNIEKVFEIKGSIAENRTSTASYFVIPEEAKDNYKLDILFSSDRIVTLYNSLNLVDKIEFFEKELIELLDLEIERVLAKGDRIIVNKKLKDIMEKYVINDFQVKRFVSDTKSSIESTVVFLLALSFVDGTDYLIESNAIVKKIIENNSSYIKSSDLLIFMLGELGYFFEDINVNFLNELKRSNRKFFYYRYFKKYNLDLSESVVEKSYNSGNLFLSESFFELMKLYYDYDSVDYKKIDSYHSVFDNILTKLLLLKRLKNNRSDSLENLDFVFKNSEIGTIKGSLKGDDIFYKNYSVDSSFYSNKSLKVINYSIEKSTNKTLYYLIKLKYKGEPYSLLESNAAKVVTDWRDENDTPVDKKNFTLKKGKWYKVNMKLYLALDKNTLFFRHNLLNCFSVDTSSLNRSSTKQFDESTFILSGLKKGESSFTLFVKPLYSGEYLMDGFLIFDLFDFTVSCKEESQKIKIFE